MKPPAPVYLCVCNKSFAFNWQRLQESGIVRLGDKTDINGGRDTTIIDRAFQRPRKGCRLIFFSWVSLCYHGRIPTLDTLDMRYVGVVVL